MSTNKAKLVVLAASLGLAVLGIVIGFGIVWAVFSPVVHHELRSPNDQLVARITKRNGREITVVIAVTITANDGTTLSQDIDQRDHWDIEEPAYSLRWRSNRELAIGDRYGSFQNGWNVKIELDDGRLVVRREHGR
jgi:hypothetical protein